MRPAYGKIILLFLFLAVTFSLFFRNIIAPSEKVYSESFHVGAERTSISFDAPYRCAYLIKFMIPADSVAQVINNFEAFINDNVIQIAGVDKLDHVIRLSVLIKAKECKPKGNVIRLSSWPKTIQISITNCKKIYARYGVIYFGNFYLFFGKEDNLAGYKLLKSMLFGMLLAFAWVFSSVVFSRLLWCDFSRVFRLEILFPVLLLFVWGGQRCALYQYGYPFMAGGAVAAVLLGGIFVTIKIVEVCVMGQERFRLVVRSVEKMMYTHEKRYQLSRVVLWVLIVSYFSVFFSLQAMRHSGFFPSMDLNGIVQLVYNAMCGRIWETQVADYAVGTYLRYHLQPVYLLVVPAYYFIRSNLVFYFIQTAVIALGALPIYWIASEKMRNKGYGVMFSFVYLVYPSVHNCTMYGFHFEELTIGLAPFAFYALIKHKRVLFVLLCLLMMMVKENIAAMVCMFGVYAFFRGERIVGVFVALVSAVWFYLCIYVIIPNFTPPGDITYSHSFFSNLVGTKDSSFQTVLINMMGLITSILSDPFKATFLFHLIAPLAFLPLLAPDVLIIALPIFAQLLFSGYVRFHSISIFYQSAVLPFVLIAAIYGFQRLVAIKGFVEKKFLKGRCVLSNVFLGGALLCSVFGFGLKNVMPPCAPGYFNKEVYVISPRDVFIKKYFDRISAESSAAVPLMYYEYLSGRRHEYPIYPDCIKKFMPDVVIVNSFICRPAYGEYRYNVDTIRYLEGSKKYMPVLKAYGFYIYENRDAHNKTGMSVFDFNNFQRIDSGAQRECVYDGFIELAEDGEYDLRVYISDNVVQQTTENKGYDSFEYLPGFKDVAELAQSFTPPSDTISSIWIYVRRLGSPTLSLSLREDIGGTPGDKDIVKVCGKKGDGIQCKYGWMRFDLGPIELDRSRRHWIVLSAEGDGYTSRYDIAAFNKEMKGEGYNERVLYRYYDSYGEWKNPYPRSGKTDDEEGNNIDGIVYRLVKNCPGIERLDIRVDGEFVLSKVVSMQKMPDNGQKAFYFSGMHLKKGVHRVSVSAQNDYQLEYVEFLRKEE